MTSLSESNQKRTGRRDTAWLEQAFDRCSPSVYAFLLRMLRNEHDANDVLQETFMHAWRRSGQFDESRGTLISWLMTIARSRALDRLRGSRTRDRYEEEAGKEISFWSGGVEEMSAFEEVELDEIRRDVREALDEIPEEQRQTILLAYFEGLTQSEIATKVAQPLGTVKTRARLGLKKLQERLERWR